MKTKSSHHKSENRFRFLTFAERLANVNIDVIHRIDRTGSLSEEVETYFYEGLQKWKDLNATENFGAFLREVNGLCQSFPQLVHHQNAVVQALKAHLQVPNSLALQPLLDLVVQLARDLQTDFYPHFPEFFSIVTGLLQTQDTDQLEWAFCCLAYLYKYLWKPLIRDIQNVYSMYSTLLAHKKEHIKNFAAESFAFLMRKVPDHSALFDWMFTDLEQNPDKCDGLGRLLFQMCRGVRMQFHSCAGRVLPIMLEKLGPRTKVGPPLPWADVSHSLCQMVQWVGDHMLKEHCSVVWDSLLDAVAKLSQMLAGDGDAEGWEQMERLLVVILTLLKHGRGKKVTEPEKISHVLVRLLEGFQVPHERASSLLKVVSTLLLAEHAFLPSHAVEQLLRAVFDSSCSQETVINFCLEMFDVPDFEQLFLPQLLQYLECSFLKGQEDQSDMAVGLLAHLVLKKAPPPTDGSMPFEKYPLLFLGKQRRSALKKGKSAVEAQGTYLNVAEYLLGLLEMPGDGWEERLPLLWATLLVLPHIRPLEKMFVNTISELIDKTVAVVRNQGEPISGLLLFVLRQAVSSLLSLTEDVDVLAVLPCPLVITLVQRFPSELSVLLLADLCYTRLALTGQHHLLSAQHLLEIFPPLEKNLSSSSARVRLLTLRILNNFEVNLHKVDEEASKQTSVFEICLRAELVEPTLPEYREKLLHMRKLRYDLLSDCVPEGPYQQVALRYLIGILYINFSMLWDPAVELISSHAREMKSKAFWEVFEEQLELAASQNERILRESLNDYETEDEAVGPNGASGSIERLCWQQKLALTVSPERQDHVNFRLHLWKAMADFPERVEPHSRDLSPLLLRFISQEYFPADLLVAPTENLRKKGCASAPTEEASAETSAAWKGESDDEEEDEKDEEVQQVQQKRKSFRKKPRRAAVRELVAHLKVFSKFSNPRALYLESKLRDLYYQLLCHRDQDVQKVVLSCLLTYKPKYLLPYRERLERLLEDRYFKDEIVHFSVSEEAGLVKAHDRAELMPVLMRILYGRMMSKTGNRTQGRAGATTRMSIVLRFLASSLPEEMHMFVRLLLEPVASFMEGSCVHAVTRTVQELELGSVIPLGRQHGILNTVDTLMANVGHLLHGHLSQLLQILLCMVASFSHILDQRDQVQPRSVALVKRLRRLGQDSLLHFFEDNDAYAFSAGELEAVFQALFWPLITRLSTESQYSPTPLLKLVQMWSQIPRFIPLLAKEHPEHLECSVLPNVYALLKAKNLSPTTAQCVLDIAENLLTVPDPESTETHSALSTQGCVLPAPASLPDGTQLELGTRLLLPHVTGILQYLAGVVKDRDKMNSKKFHDQVSKNLNILSRVSKFVVNEEQSSLLIGLLVPYLSKANLGQDMEVDILETIMNLLKRVSVPGSYLKPLACLLSCLQNKLSRQALSAVFQTLGELDNTVTYITDVIVQMNAFDRRHLDDINFDIRLEAFQAATKYVAGMEKVDSGYLLPLLHNCFYSIQLTEMALSDNASLCLATVVQRLAIISHTEEEFREVITRTLLVAVRRGLKSQTQNVLHEYVGLLRCLVHTFPHRVEFQDLVTLTDPDPESDFFENMRHIQVYRRARALKRVARQLQDGSLRICATALQSFIMPFATTPLANPKFSKQENVVEACVDALGAICRHLPWKPYLYTLRHYIHLLQTTQLELKLAISLLITVLDAFHFDLETLQREAEQSIRESPAAAVEAAMDGEDGDDAMLLGEEAACGEGEAAEPMEEGSTQALGLGGEVADDAAAPAAPAVPAVPSHCLNGQQLQEQVQQTITANVLPKLLACLATRSKAEMDHKAVRTRGVDEEQVARIPLALAVVKLLQALPSKVLEANLPSVVLKVCFMLRNRLQEVRDVARGVLIKIADALGPSHLPYVLQELKSTLTRGFQLHVMSFTAHYLLKSLTANMQPGQLDPCVNIFVQVCNDELFGEVAEEKEVQGIVRKSMEARSCKSYDTYELLGQFVSCSHVAALIHPLKQVLEGTMSHKVAHKVQECLRRLVLGLLENCQLTGDTYLLLSHAMITDSLPILIKKASKDRVAALSAPNARPPSCLLLPPTPTRGGEKAAVNARTNVHILVEFGLQVLHLTLKRSKVKMTEKKVLEMVDPFVLLLCDCLDSKHVKVVASALRCLAWSLRCPLPSLGRLADRLTKQLFLLLKNYACAGAAKGDNFEMILSCFKVMTVLVRHMEKSQLTEKQLQVLLGYAEEDIHDSSRQATAFGLLKAIVQRRLMVPEMHEVMTKVAELAITDQAEAVRVQCRQVYLTFIMDYPLGKKLGEHLEFIVSQLTYEHESGRDSALEMLVSIFQSFPQELLLESSSLFFLPLALMLVNDASARCRKMAALAARTLLDKISAEKRDSLFSLATSWFQRKKVPMRQLAAHACGLFVEVEGAEFDRRLTSLLPCIAQDLQPSNHENVEKKTQENAADHLLFALLTLLSKILKGCPLVFSATHRKNMNTIWASVQAHLQQPHSWVRLAACQLFGLLFATWNPEELVAQAKQLEMASASKKDYIVHDLNTKVKELVKAFCFQLQSKFLSPDLGEQVVKNLIFLSRVMYLLHADLTLPTAVGTDVRTDMDMDGEEDGAEEGDGGKEAETTEKSQACLTWLMKKLCFMAKKEAANTPLVSLKRTCVFKFFAAIALDLGKEKTTPFLVIILRPLHRELHSTYVEHDPTLKTLSQEIIELLKGLVGVEEFSLAYSSVQKQANQKRTERKVQRAQQAVANPEIAARRKMKKHKNKVEAQKRKLEVLRPDYKAKRQKTKSVRELAILE
ncbi:small subunit processome component 20 homolog [Lethenteron reissneri]|uniref:small subunit processome component 20 homolog n=1 Tax=Lethenteron reissneri TaxID=7753 RepID=UPI002AB72FC7|nr:small subunit processome component 20 homolog [Lethenteron reissneri]